MAKLPAVGQLKRLCQHAAQLRWNSAPHQCRSRQPTTHISNHNWIRTDHLHSAAYRFAFTARTDMHPTYANKQRWRQTPDSNCRQCDAREDIHHVLSFCPAMMNEKRKRHDSVLNLIARAVRYNNHGAQLLINQAPTDILALFARRRYKTGTK
ncbi:hypothetical protein NQZ79_g4292 [Umbelopsis isabellina]|nr:hypothetical protein NQZ79_g4292 [Umbelopsis isabellina]